MKPNGMTRDKLARIMVAAFQRAAHFVDPARIERDAGLSALAMGWRHADADVEVQVWVREAGVVEMLPADAKTPPPQGDGGAVSQRGQATTATRERKS